MKKKRGISLMMLSIIVIVLCIMTSSIVVTASTAKNMAKNINITSEMQTLEDSIKEQLALTGKLPVSEENKYTSEEMIDKVSSKDADTLKKQIEQNKDTNQIFYKVDIEKVGVASTRRGLEKQSINDVFYVTGENLNVYYLQGVKLEKGKVFTNITEDEIEKKEEVEEVLAYKEVNQNLDIEKLDKFWSSEIEFEIGLELEDNEKLYVNFLDVNSKVIYTQDITSIAHAKIYKISKDLADANILNSMTKVSFVLKSDSHGDITKEIEVKNIDITCPTINEEKTKAETIEEDFVVSLYVFDKRSGADELVYINKQELENVEDDEKTFFILNKGKKASMKKTGNKYEYYTQVTLIPGEYEAVCIDKAGNILENISMK